MNHRLSLHHLTILDASPTELVLIAASLSCKYVTLFTNLPDKARGKYPLVSIGDASKLGAVLQESNVHVCNLEVFPLDDDDSLQKFCEGLEVGQALGAQRATAHIHNVVNTEDAVRRFAAFAAFAAKFGITAGLEFNAFSGVKTLSAAANVVNLAGGGSIVLDTLHLMRNGAEVEAVARYADLIDYVQVSDGPLQLKVKAWHEAIVERALPGQGEFPLRAILAPLVGKAIMEAEVPRLFGEAPMNDRARAAVEALTTVLQTVPALP